MNSFQQPEEPSGSPHRRSPGKDQSCFRHCNTEHSHHKHHSWKDLISVNVISKPLPACQNDQSKDAHNKKSFSSTAAPT